MDQEYLSFMAELKGDKAPSAVQKSENGPSMPVADAVPAPLPPPNSGSGGSGNNGGKDSKLWPISDGREHHGEKTVPETTPNPPTPAFSPAVSGLTNPPASTPGAFPPGYQAQEMPPSYGYGYPGFPSGYGTSAAYAAHQHAAYAAHYHAQQQAYAQYYYGSAAGGAQGSEAPEEKDKAS